MFTSAVNLPALPQRSEPVSHRLLLPERRAVIRWQARMEGGDLVDLLAEVRLGGSRAADRGEPADGDADSGDEQRRNSADHRQPTGVFLIPGQQPVRDLLRRPRGWPRHRLQLEPRGAVSFGETSRGRENGTCRGGSVRAAPPSPRTANRRNRDRSKRPAADRATGSPS